MVCALSVGSTRIRTVHITPLLSYVVSLSLSNITFHALSVTVQPSHVDVRTQASYQLLDSSFVGVIMSCFARSELDGGGADRVQIGAF